MLNLEAIKDYIKYTVTLAGIGFAYVSTVDTTGGLFGWELGDGVVRGLAGLLLFLLFLSTLFGIFVISGAVRYDNEMAAAAAKLPAPAPGAPPPHVTPPPAAQRALAAVRKYTNWHLYLLIAGFVGVAIVFADSFVDASAAASRCEMDLPTAPGAASGVRLSFDCSAELAQILAGTKP